MKFAKFVFSIAGIWGIFVLTPLYFMFNIIGVQDPPPITHPDYYGIDTPEQDKLLAATHDLEGMRPRPKIPNRGS